MDIWQVVSLMPLRLRRCAKIIAVRVTFLANPGQARLPTRRRSRESRLSSAPGSANEHSPTRARSPLAADLARRLVPVPEAPHGLDRRAVRIVRIEPAAQGADGQLHLV